MFFSPGGDAILISMPRVCFFPPSEHIEHPISDDEDDDNFHSSYLSHLQSQRVPAFKVEGDDGK